MSDLDELTSELGTALVDVEGASSGVEPLAKDATPGKQDGAVDGSEAETEELMEDGRVLAYPQIFAAIDALVAQQDLESAVNLSRQIVDEIMPIYSTTRQRLLFGPSMLVTAFAINQYANILCKLKELTLCKQYTLLALDILEERARLPANPGPASDVELLHAVMDEARERLTVTENLLTASPTFLAEEGFSFDPDINADSMPPYPVAPPEHEWPAIMAKFEADQQARFVSEGSQSQDEKAAKVEVDEAGDSGRRVGAGDGVSDMKGKQAATLRRPTDQPER